jgi:hypothetical protein
MNLFGLLINGSIYLSAAGAIVMRFLRRALLPMLDRAAIVGSLWLIRNFFGEGPIGLDRVWHFLALFATGGLLGSAVCGAYDVPVKLANILKGATLTAIGVLVYDLFHPTTPIDPFDAIGLIAAMIIAQISVRLLLHSAKLKPYSLRSLDLKRVLAIGGAEENKHALALLWQTHFGLGRQKQMSIEQGQALDAASEIRREVRRHSIDEVVFCAKDLPWARIIDLMEQLRTTGVLFKIAQPTREFIIGPNSIESLQDLFLMEPHAVNSSGTPQQADHGSWPWLLLLPSPAPITSGSCAIGRTSCATGGWCSCRRIELGGLPRRHRTEPANCHHACQG